MSASSIAAAAPRQAFRRNISSPPLAEVAGGATMPTARHITSALVSIHTLAELALGWRDERAERRGDRLRPRRFRLPRAADLRNPGPCGGDRGDAQSAAPRTGAA